MSGEVGWSEVAPTFLPTRRKRPAVRGFLRTREERGRTPELKSTKLSLIKSTWRMRGGWTALRRPG